MIAIAMVMVGRHFLSPSTYFFTVMFLYATTVMTRA